MTGADRRDLTVERVRDLLAAQFPQWANLPIRPVEFDGWDNRTFRLGDHMKVRLPSAARYAPQAEKEYHWLAKLAPSLPLTIPSPRGLGTPTNDFPWPWAVFSWLDGQTATASRITDPTAFAVGAAQFLLALQSVDASAGPVAGPHNFFRGGSLAVYDEEARQAIATLTAATEACRALATWETALAAEWRQSPVWVHGDFAPGNLLVKDGRLTAVIDFGSAGVGDPACDLTLAWLLFSGESRETFRATMGADDATWARARGWALWKALSAVGQDAKPGEAPARRVIAAVLAEYQHGV